MVELGITLIVMGNLYILSLVRTRDVGRSTAGRVTIDTRYVSNVIVYSDLISRPFDRNALLL